MKDFHEKPWMCWKCGYAMDAAGNLTDDHAPSDGDISMCLNCGNLYCRHGDAWKVATTPEIRCLPPKKQGLLLRMQAARRVIVDEDLSKKDGRA